MSTFRQRRSPFIFQINPHGTGDRWIDVQRFITKEEAVTRMRVCAKRAPAASYRVIRDGFDENDSITLGQMMARKS